LGDRVFWERSDFVAAGAIAFLWVEGRSRFVGKCDRFWEERGDRGFEGKGAIDFWGRGDRVLVGRRAISFWEWSDRVWERAIAILFGRCAIA